MIESTLTMTDLGEVCCKVLSGVEHDIIGINQPMRGISKGKFKGEVVFLGSENNAMLFMSYKHS